MNELTIFLVGAIAAATAGAVGYARRRDNSPIVRASVGFGLVGASLIVGVVFLAQRDIPPPLSGGIGVMPAKPVLPSDKRGLAVALATRVDSCSNPVTATLVAAGTAEYWSDYRAIVRPTTNESVRLPFLIVLPKGVTGRPSVGLAANGTDIEDPFDARFATTADIQWKVVSIREGTAIRGTVTDWPITLRPLMVRFRANWLEPRGLSSCYVRVPALTGTSTAGSLVEALGNDCRQVNQLFPTAKEPACQTKIQAGRVPYVAGFMPTYGTSIVAVTSGEVSPSLSEPPPTKVVNGDQAWTCTSNEETVGPFPRRRDAPVPDSVNGSEVTAFSLSAIENAAGSCRAVVAIDEGSASYSRDLLILVVGAVIGLGLTFAVEAVFAKFAPDKPRGDGAATQSVVTSTSEVERSAPEQSQRTDPKDGGSRS
jgi:hypothetical protein